MKKAVVILFIVSAWLKANGQSNIVFQHLNTSNGLSYGGLNTMCTDQRGNLWIATGNGLNMFNGKTVVKYYASEYPQLNSSYVVHVTCDSNNRIWAHTTNGHITMLDERRQLHRVALYDKGKFIRTKNILNSQHGGIILFTDKGFYAFNESNTSSFDTLSFAQFSFVHIQSFDTLLAKRFVQAFYYDDDNYLMMDEDAFYKVNFRTKTVERKYALPHCTALTNWGNNELLLYDKDSKEVKLLNLGTGAISFPFKGLKDQYGKEVTAFFFSGEKINENKYVFTTFYEGIFIYDRSNNKIYNYRHNVSDPTSISNDIQKNITVTSKGWVFIACNPAGISYFNSNDFIGNQFVFTDAAGRGFDGYIAGIATKDNNTYYIGTAQGLIEWKRNTNTTTFIDCPGAVGRNDVIKEEVSSVILDKNDRIWASTVAHGIYVFDKNKRLLKHISDSVNGKLHLKIHQATCLRLSPDNDIWVFGGSGICKISAQTFEIDNLTNTPLARFDTLFCNPAFFADKNNLWFGTTTIGAFHYNLQTQKLDHYNAAKGLASNNIFCLGMDSLYNIYIGTRYGLSVVFPNGRIKNFKQKDGLLLDRAEGILLDKKGRVWIGNDIGLACYNPKDSSLITFDERYGLSIYGFRVGSYFQTSNEEFILGTPRGLQYFHPDSLFNKKVTLTASINRIETKKVNSNINDNASFKLAATDKSVTFYFSSVDFSPHLRTYYEYRLTGLDKDWIRIADQNSASYNSLPPGKYTFNLRVSNDNKNWQDSQNEVAIVIATPFYQTTWFKVLGYLLAVAIIFFVTNYYRKKQELKRNELETELVITYFASQINSHHNTGDLLWDIAKNCISKLYFEDCVIYLKDDEKNVLVQKAAYGPKNPVDFTIHQPIEIPIGKGIVGYVAQSGKPELVSDTESDSRYIVDDEKRHSELAVPIVIDKKVIGVIDSEHHEKNFFSQRHLQVLSTIAALCANQIQKTKAEEDKQRATIELLENKQKAAESRLQSLRLQMNPHFLFNALNSIQQMILSNEDIVATRYLSKFSRLLRTILVHSDNETISLKDELEMLNLYVELESIRFKESFKYKIICDEAIDTDEVKIPALLVQPFVENAIWHGLMHKEGERTLEVTFTEEGDFIKCVIQDNGVGRKKAAEMKIATGKDKKHTSKGIEVSKERLKTLKTKDGREGSIQIVDLGNGDGKDHGTRVEINFSIQN